MTIKRKVRCFSIPLNAMCDVAFLLLIFIMVVSLVNYRVTVPIEYAESERPAPKVGAQKNCEIWVDATGRLFLNGSIASESDIATEIDFLRRVSPDTRVHLIADRNTMYEKIDRVIQILEKADYPLVSFVVKNN
jgi:biopolymer transport protein ExbD